MSDAAIKPVSMQRLRDLHASPKNVSGNYRYASPGQMDEFYAMHEAFPLLDDIVQAFAALAGIADFSATPHEHKVIRRGELALERLGDVLG